MLRYVLPLSNAHQLHLGTLSVLANKANEAALYRHSKIKAPVRKLLLVPPCVPVEEQSRGPELGFRGWRSSRVRSVGCMCTVSGIDTRRQSQKRQQSEQEELVLAREWQGLETWRDRGVDERRIWGKSGPVVFQDRPPHSTSSIESQIMVDRGGEVTSKDIVLPNSLAECGRLVLLTDDPRRKAELTHAVFRAWTDGMLPLGTAEAPEQPARPAKPELVSPREVPQPNNSPLPPSAHILHNVTHVELNAIDLAWDTVVRFSPDAPALGRQFFSDFARVADDESRHLSWCLQRLDELGFSYGDIPAHNLLWQDCAKTSGHISSRLAIIPMSQEARGLDAGPRVAERLVGFGDNRSAHIVSRIADEEIAHVAVGVAWFLRVCDAMAVDPAASFQTAIARFCPEPPRGPFNHAARAQAGIPRHWYDAPADSQSAREDKGRLERGSGRDGTGGGASSDLPRPRTKAAAEERKQLSKEVRKLEARVDKCSGLLRDPEFTEKAARTAVNATRARQLAVQDRLSQVHERLAVLVAMEEQNA